MKISWNKWYVKIHAEIVTSTQIQMEKFRLKICHGLYKFSIILWLQNNVGYGSQVQGQIRLLCFWPESLNFTLTSNLRFFMGMESGQIYTTDMSSSAKVKFSWFSRIQVSLLFADWNFGVNFDFQPTLFRVHENRASIYYWYEFVSKLILHCWWVQKFNMVHVYIKTCWWLIIEL